MRNKLSALKSGLAEHLFQLFGPRMDQKIVIFESDDWGMIRMASRVAYDAFLKLGYEVDACPYNKNDGLETAHDLEIILDTLDSVRDADGKAAKFTINNIVGNPDFEAIRASDFQQYHWEPFTKTFNRLSSGENVMALYKEGIEKGLIQPQFHGREHIGCERWLRALRANSKKHMLAFDYEMYTVHDKGVPGCNKDFLNAFVPENPQSETIEMRIKDGLKTFEDIWGFKSASIIAPCYTWSPQIEPCLWESGVRLIQGGRVQLIPSVKGESFGKKYHYCGQRNNVGQYYLIRNVHFEPVESPDTDHVDAAMRQLKIAFQHKKPAIIGSHRVNYIGSIHPENQENNIRQLKILLKRIVKAWPDVLFLTSDELLKRKEFQH
ncbi:MAG: hypothetical protein NW218_19425 [Saprospiraceae bacterium]|nr:hypothetical protein [Saprospiraceae bacterium]